MLLLALETTCDETAAAVIRDDLSVLGSAVATQDALHQRFRGIVPELASRAHVERIVPVIDEALRKAGVGLADLSCIAVANTPGLAGSLIVGLSAAKSLAVALDLPLVAINHVFAHVYACQLASAEPVFPCVGLVVSGFVWNLALQVAAPFFNVYLVRHLGAGAGTVGRVVASLGREWVGVELDPRMARLTARRLRLKRLRPTL